jgi:hypothetical protein
VLLGCLCAVAFVTYLPVTALRALPFTDVLLGFRIKGFYHKLWNAMACLHPICSRLGINSWRGDEMGYYDAVLICRNGHKINVSAHRYPQHNTKFCTEWWCCDHVAM